MTQVPYVFTPGETISSNHVNADFSFVTPGLFLQTTITTDTQVLTAPGIYSIATGTGAFTCYLPLAGSLADGSGLFVVDGDNNASANNITLTAQGSDVIRYYAQSGSTLVINTNSSGFYVFTRNGAWRAAPWG